MNRTPTISVLIPVNNQEKFIGRCIRSVLNQKYPDSEFEIIVVNDASTDRTRDALEPYINDIRLIESPRQLGLPASLNKGIKGSRGRFVIRVDADDYVHAEYLNVLSLHLALNDYMDAIACDYQIVNEAEEVLEIKNCIENPIGCGIMFRKEQLIDLGMYDESFLLHEDKDLRIRFLEKYKIYRVALPLYRYRQHGNNLTNNLQAMAEYQRELERKHRGER